MPDSTSSKSRSGWSLDQRNPDFIRSLMPLWEWLYRYYFRVESEGWEHIPEGQVLFVGSHNGGLAAPDMFMSIYDWFQHFGLDRPIYGLMHPKVWKAFPPLAEMAVQVGAIVAHPKMAMTALQKGASVLVYPGGAQDVFRPYALRHRIHLAGNRAFIKLALLQEVPIVPVVSTGAHETLIVLDNFYPLAKQLHEWGMPWLLNLDPEVFPIYLGLPWGLAIGPLPNLPWPSPIKLRIGAPIQFPRYGRAAAHDAEYVDHCYQQVLLQMQQDLDQLVQTSFPKPV